MFICKGALTAKVHLKNVVFENFVVSRQRPTFLFLPGVDFLVLATNTAAYDNDIERRDKWNLFYNQASSFLTSTLPSSGVFPFTSRTSGLEEGLKPPVQFSTQSFPFLYSGGEHDVQLSALPSQSAQREVQGLHTVSR